MMSIFRKGLLVSFIFAGISFLRNAIKTDCLWYMPRDAYKLFRHPVDCDFCIDVFEVTKVTNVSPTDFDEFYVSKGKPVVVTDGTRDWEASTVFTFEFFKNLYLSTDPDEFDCQFFPYQTEFVSLHDALNMSQDRAKLMPGTKPWYIGWSNCNNEIGKVLRKFYRTPYFIPPSSEDIALSWIFVGGPGNGASMHVDNVRYPSWQAQLKGRKKWKLVPPPECYFKCRQLEVTLEPGEIIVVDTNRWYHQTFILPGELSITIGAEFD